MTDEAGKQACVLTCNDRGAIMEFGGENTKTRLRLFCRKDSAAGVHIVQENGDEAASMGRTSKGTAYHLLQVDGHALDENVSENGVANDKH